VPELPDVEGFRRVFARHATRRTVRALWLDRRAGRNVTPRALSRALRGRRFERPRRHGKWLIAPCGGPALLLHFGMTGDLCWEAEPGPRHPHDRLALDLARGRLVFRDMRRFGGVWLAETAERLDERLARLGPDALDVTRADFLARLDRRRGSVKAALMDQTVVAGLGNLIVDESLWRARIRPARAVSSLSTAERARIHRDMRWVLRRSVPEGRVPDFAGWLTAERGRRGVCPRCGKRLSRAAVAGRTTYWCSDCQS